MAGHHSAIGFDPPCPGMGRPARQRAHDLDNFNPLADGILMLHQRQVAALKASIIAIPKGRRTGITFGTMLDKTLVAAARKSAGGDNVYYIGDTRKRPGGDRLLRKLRPRDCAGPGRGCSGVEEFLSKTRTKVARPSTSRRTASGLQAAFRCAPCPAGQRTSAACRACRHRRGGLSTRMCRACWTRPLHSDLGRSDHHHQFA